MTPLDERAVGAEADPPGDLGIEAFDLPAVEQNAHVCGLHHARSGLA